MSTRGNGRGRSAGRGPGGTAIPDRWGLTPYQLAMVTFAMIGVTAIAGLPTVLADYAGQEAWMAALLALPVGLLPLVLIHDLERRRPGLTLVEHARAALGPVAGGLLALPSILLLLSVTPLGARQIDTLIRAEGLPRTPQIVIAGLLILAPLYATRQGPEVLARLAEAVIPIALGTVFIIVLVSLHSVRAENLEPLTAVGWGPLLQAAMAAAAWYAETAVLGFVLPFRGHSLRSSWVGVAAALAAIGLLLALATAWTLAVLGPLAGNVTFAIFQVTRAASLAEFLTHLDALLVVAWAAGEFARTGFWFYCLCLALGQFLGLSDYRPLTLPLAAVVVLGATTWFESATQFNQWIAHAWPFWGIGLGLGSPLLIWLAAVARDRRDRRQRRRSHPRRGRPARGGDPAPAAGGPLGG